MRVNAKIDNIRLYKFHIFPQNAKNGQEHLFIRISSGGASGWGECRIPITKAGIESFNAAKALDGLYGKTVSDALKFVNSVFGNWRYSVSEMAEMALIDLEGNLTGRSALEVLGLDSIAPVMTANAIPANDREGIMRRLEQVVLNDGRIAKIHLTGNYDYDRETIELIRSEYDRERLYLIGSASGAYTNTYDFSAEKVGVQLLKMYATGLDAVEDAADINIEQWASLQEFCSPLPLVAQSILKPARQAMALVNENCADIYCIRPGVHGSVFDALTLAKRMKNAGKSVSVGDDGFIGPGCTQWQQIAIGLGAEWVEALEKNGLSDIYRSNLVRCPIIYGEGSVSMTGGSAGFGLEIDDRMLELDCTQVVEL